jgi:peptide/nickel transport system substrate-binding protein
VLACALLLIGVLVVPMTGFAHPEPQRGKGQNYGGTLIISNRVEMKTFNGNFDIDFESYFATHAGIFNRLLSLDTRTGTVFPDLAERWTVNADATVYTFYIHPRAKWHDGRPATSEDVKWTYDKILREKSWQASNLGDITAIDTPNAQTVVFRLKNSDAAFLTTISELNGPIILPKHVYDGTDWRTNPRNDRPIGTGAFKFVEWIKGSHVKMVANLDYHWGRPYVDYLILRFIPSMAVDTAALERGEIHYMSQSPPITEWKRMAADPNLTVNVQPEILPIWMAFNVRQKPWDDIRVRRAIAMAVDKDDIARRVYQGFAPVSKGSYLSNSWAFNANAKEPPFDVRRAEALLDEAGLRRGPDGVRLRTTISDSITLGFRETNEVLREQFRRIGIDVRIESIEWGSFTEKVLKKYDFDLALVGGPHGPDPDVFCNFVCTGRVRNSMGYTNPRVDDLFEKARAAGDRNARRRLYFEIQEILARELPRFNIVEYAWAYAHRADWEGFYSDKDYRNQVPRYDMSHVYHKRAAGTTLR